MKQPKKLTRELKEAASAYGLVADKWMLLKDSGGAYVTLVHKETGKTKVIDRYARRAKR